MATKHTSERRVYSYTQRERVNQTTWYSTGGGNSFDQTLFNVFSGVQNPDWWRMVRYKQNATTIASGTLQRVLVGPGHCYMAYQAPGQLVEREISGDKHLEILEPPPGEVAGMSASVQNAVLTRFLLRCLAEQRKFQGFAVLGELRKTIQLIRNPLKSLDRLITEYARACRRRSRQLSPRLIPRMLNEEYLSFTYGAVPLFHDISGAYNACLRLRDLPQTVKVRAYAELENQVTSSAGSSTFYDIPFHFEKVRYVRVSGIIRGEVKVKSVGPVPPLMEVTGTQLRDFIPAVYELIPYSFLLDYFVNVGDILNCLSFCQSDLAWHSRTMRTKGVAKVFLSPARPGSVFGHPVVGYSFNPCYAEHSQTSFFRDATPLGLPSLVFKLPSQGQGVNIASLAAARVL